MIRGDYLQVTDPTFGLDISCRSFTDKNKLFLDEQHEIGTVLRSLLG